MQNELAIYCESEYSDFCQDLLFKKGFDWSDNFDLPYTKIDLPESSLICFYVNFHIISNEENEHLKGVMSYDWMMEHERYDEYIKAIEDEGAIYWQEYFKPLLRESKLERICK